MAFQGFSKNYLNILIVKVFEHLLLHNLLFDTKYYHDHQISYLNLGLKIGSEKK